MIDEKLLRDRLGDAAGAQDGLLPRAIADDLAAGRRRLLRRRVFTGGSAVVAAGAVAAVSLGLGGAMRDAGPLPNDLPVATRHTPDPAVAAARDKFIDQRMKSLLGRHLDPANKHLDFSPGSFVLRTDPGQRYTLQLVGWRLPGQQKEGQLEVQLWASQRVATSVCGFYRTALTCHETTLPNGRMAMIGRKGEAVEISYLQEDGEFAYVAVEPSPGTGITDAQLKAFVSDPDLDLPELSATELAEEKRMVNFAPSREQAQAAVGRHLGGGQLDDLKVSDHSGQFALNETWQNGAASARVEVGVVGSWLTGPCAAQLSTQKCEEQTVSRWEQGGVLRGAADL